MVEGFTSVEVLGPGILVYRNAVPKELNIIERLEKALDNRDPNYTWMPAYVGYRELMPDYRDCVDFKFKKTDIAADTSQVSLELQDLWQDVYDKQKPAVDDYCKRYNIMNLRYWEAFNFIKYNNGQHFQTHSDHGYSYNATVSLVAYVNDDYEGGGLYFPHFELDIKPKAGDLYIFPSTYIYSHRAMPVKNGTKYSIVTMLDYSAKFHTPEMYVETGD